MKTRLGMCLLVCLTTASPASPAPGPRRGSRQQPPPAAYVGLGHTGPVTALAWSPDGKTLATGSADQTIILWDAATGRPQATLAGYTAAIARVAWSPDGKRLAGSDAGTTAILWDAATGRRRAVLTPLAGAQDELFGRQPPNSSRVSLVSHSETSPIEALTWSPDGKLLAGAEFPNVLLWDGATGRRRATRRLGDVDLLRWSPDGKTLAIGGGPVGIAVSFWDVREGARHRGLAYDAGDLETLAWSPNGKEIAGTDDERAVLIWDVATGRRRSLMPRHVGEPYGANPLAWSPDGTQLAAGRNDRGDAIVVWSAATGKREAEWTDPDLDKAVLGLSALLWSPNGRTLAVQGAYMARLALWDPATRTRRGVLAPAIGPIAWRPDGTLLATGGMACTASLWNAGTGARQAVLNARTGPLRHLAWSPDGRALAAGTDELDQLPASVDASQGFVAVWDAASGKPRAWLKGLSDGPPRNILSGLPDHIYDLAWSPSGAMIATTAGQYGMEWGLVGGGGPPPRVWYRSSAMLWDAETGRRCGTLPGATAVVAWSPDGRTLATGSGRSVLVWDLASGKRRATLPVGTEVWQVAWSPDGKTLSTPSFTPKGFAYSLWDPATWKERASLPVPGSAYSVSAWSPDGSLLATTRDDRLVDLWDTSHGALLRSLILRAAPPPQADDWVTARTASLAWSPDGTLLAVGLPRDGTLKLWRPKSGQLAAILLGPAPGAAPLWSPDGQTIAAAYADHTVILWSPAARKRRAVLRGHSGAVTAMAWSPDGRTLATGSQDGSLRLWDGATGRERVTLYSLNGGTEWLAITPEGYFAASAHGADVIQWRQDAELWPLAKFRRRFERPDLVRRALMGQLDRRGEKPDNQASRPSDAAANKALVRGYYDALNSGLRAHNDSAATRDFAAIDRLFAPNYVRHVSALARAPERLAPGTVAAALDPRTLLKLFAIGLRANVSGGAYAVEDQIAEGDRVATRWSFHGTTKRGTGDAGSPTGKPVTMTGIEIDRIWGGKIVESWGMTDVTHLPALKLPLDQW